MALSCPNCGSADCSKVSVVYESGTFKGNVAGAGIALNGQIDFGGGQTEDRTLPANSLAPPKASGCFGVVVALVTLVVGFPVGFILLSGVTGLMEAMGFNPSSPWWFCSYVIMVIVIAIALGGICHGRVIARMRRAREAWERSWICMRCGYTWILPSGQGIPGGQVIAQKDLAMLPPVLRAALRNLLLTLIVLANIVVFVAYGFIWSMLTGQATIFYGSQPGNERSIFCDIASIVFMLWAILRLPALLFVQLILPKLMRKLLQIASEGWNAVKLDGGEKLAIILASLDIFLQIFMMALYAYEAFRRHHT